MPSSGRDIVALRGRFQLDRVPEVAVGRACSVSVYALEVNGAEVARGPLRSNPQRQPFDVFDLAPHLVAGENMVTAIVCRYDSATPWWMPPPMFGNDLVHGAFVFEAMVGDDWWFTDAAWTARRLDGWGSSQGSGISGRGQELVDARSLPSDWRTSDDGWSPALVRRAVTTGEPGRPQPPSYPGGPLLARPLSWPTVERVPLQLVEGTSVSASDATHYAAGRIVVGTVEVEVEGPAGSDVTVTAAEFLDANGRPAPNEHDSSVRFVCDGTRRTLSSVDRFGLHGAVVNATGGATVHGLSIVERVHPVTGDHGFECSDPDLETIFAVGRRTVSICSLDAYIDCPTREQRAWTGDSVVHQMVDLATNDDWTLARWHPRLAASPRPDGMLPMAVAGDAEFHDFTMIPDWALHWVHSVWNLHRYVGDQAEIAALMPAVEGVLRWFERFCDDDGLPTDVFGWVIIDWSAIYTEGVSAALCGLWARGLVEFAEMACWLGDEGRAAWATGAHERLRRGVERLWDPDRRRYVDSTVGGERRAMASQHGQAAMIVGRLAPADRFERLVEVMTDEAHLRHLSFSKPDGYAEPNSDLTPGGPFLRLGHPEPWLDLDRDVVRAQPFFRYVVHDAIAQAGRADLIATLCRDWLVALERSPTSWVETWYGGTVSHGWSSTPTRDLIVRVLGVEPLEPGFGVARIGPALGHLAFARGSAPCGGGRRITVDADRDRVIVDSPVPFEYAGTRFPPGTHTLPA